MALTTSELDAVLGAPRLRRTLSYAGTMAADQFARLAAEQPAGAFSAVINRADSDAAGDHWVSVRASEPDAEGRRHVVYFDSYGLDPGVEQRLLGDRTDLGAALKKLANGGRVEMNDYDYQSLLSSTCGKWAAMALVDPEWVRSQRGVGDTRSRDSAVIRRWHALKNWVSPSGPSAHSGPKRRRE